MYGNLILRTFDCLNRGSTVLGMHSDAQLVCLVPFEHQKKWERVPLDESQ